MVLEHRDAPDRRNLNRRLHLAIRKLPLPLFAAKTRVLSGWTEISAPSFVRANPLLLSGAMVVPTIARRAVLRIHFKENANVNQQGQRR
jgi:hypothetical protein